MRSKKIQNYPINIISAGWVMAAVLLIVTAGSNYYWISRDREARKVEAVIDGDTFVLQKGERVRLLGVDAPERGECGYAEAKSALLQLILGKTVDLKEGKKDQYGRTMALVYSDGEMVNGTMLVNGWGKYDYTPSSEKQVLLGDYRRAQTERKGVWGILCRKLPEGKCVIKGNIDENTGLRFYHLPWCGHYAETTVDKSRGEKYFCTEEEAAAEGFMRANGCD